MLGPYRDIHLPRWFWAAFGGFIGPVLILGDSPTPAGVVVAFVTIGISFVHAVFALGWRDALVFLGICLAVTFSLENLSVLTGVPFGHYHFVVGGGLPHVGSIPVIVGLLYFGLGYPSRVIAGILLDRAGLVPDTLFRVVALPLVASFVLVQWAVVMDPAGSTLGGAWVWHDGGGYFGVPLSNYLGWYPTVWMFFQAFACWVFFTWLWSDGGLEESVLADSGVAVFLGGGLPDLTSTGWSGCCCCGRCGRVLAGA